MKNNRYSFLANPVGLRFLVRLTLALIVAFVSEPRGSAQSVKEVVAFSSTQSSPAPGLVIPSQGRDGGLYGTTTGDGDTMTDGIVFRATTNGKEATVHTFTGADGAGPFAGLTLATDGNFYGTATGGGDFGNGVLFRVSASGLYTVLHAFSGNEDGGVPLAPPVQGWDGNLYGTTTFGTVSAGTVYKYTLSGTFSTMFSFDSDRSQGTQTTSTLLQANDGSLYGVANSGGSNNCGTIFKVSRTGTLLLDYSFPCGAGGWVPAGGLTQASDGNFYGTTELGGITQSSGDCAAGCGIVYRMTPSGAVSVLYRFTGGKNDGAAPVAGLVQAPDGNLYGTTSRGGASDVGTIYTISLNGAESMLYSFTSNIGEHPGAALLRHTNGKFYGTTELGGTFGEGSLYSLDMGFSPFISFVVPVGHSGQTAEILGQGFTGSTGVTFNGIPATSFRVLNDTYLTAVVPAGATTGLVVVTTATGTLTSNVNFRVIP
jgi:uncharacterized repeat protein (TIGR03803 family)